MKKFSKVIYLVSSILICLFPISTLALSKDEVVYATLNSKGKVKKTLVSEHLINNEKQNIIHDYTTLTNIKNVNGDEGFKIQDEKIIWESNGEDIYYQGNSQDELPIKMEVTYKLNGKEMSAKKMKGKKGHVEIQINYKNQLINYIGNETLYTPFVIGTEMNLSTKENRNISVTSGKVISNGKQNIIACLSSPGLYDSLKISSLKNLDSITIQYDTTNFKKAKIYAVATSKVLEESDFNQLNSLNGIFKQVETLQTASNTIVDGSKQLSSGAEELETGINSAYQGTTTLKNSLNQAIISLQNDNSNALDMQTIEMIKNQAIAGATLTDEQKNIITEKVNKSVEETINSSLELLASKGITYTLIQTCEQDPIPDADQSVCSNALPYINQFKLLNDQTTVALLKEVAKNSAINTAIEVSQTVAGTVSENVAMQVSNKVKQEATKKSIESLNTLSQNIEILNQGLAQLNQGSMRLKDGANSLYQGTVNFNDGGIKQISSFVGNTLKRKTKALKKLQTLSENYESFAMKDSQIKGTTKFIMTIQ